MTAARLARRLGTQAYVGAATLGAALAVLALSQARADYALRQDASVFAVSLVLVVGIVFAYQFPIHIRHDSKIYVISIPVYLLSVLLTPGMAAVAVGLGVFTGEIVTRSRKQRHFGTVVTQAGRWVVLVYLASAIAHLPPVPGSNTLLHPRLLSAGLVLWLGDLITVPLLIAPLSGGAPWRITARMLREAGGAEGVQYAVAFLGAVATRHEVWSLLLLALPSVLVYIALKSTKEMHDGTRQMLESMADTVDMRDPYTGGHSRRVAELVERIVQVMEVDRTEARLIVSSARVHDIGKIAVPDEVLKKDGPLTEGERSIIESHAEHGASFLMRYRDFARGAEIVRHHHERWDGQGYPHGLRGAEIPFGSRVIAVADSFDAMTSHRPYRSAMMPSQAAAILRQGRGRQWDAAIVDAFLRCIADRRESPEPMLHLVTAADLEPADDAAALGGSS